MINKILIPTDYSDSSLNALNTAIHIALENKASLLILHIADESRSFNRTKETPVFTNGQQIGEAMASSILHKHNIPTEMIFTQGIVGPAIIKAAYEHSADLIVMGTHGASGKRDLYIGSNTYFVIKNSECPVLSIPEDKKWDQFKMVLYPVRSTFGALKQFDTVKMIISNKNCQFEVLGLLIDNHSNDTERLNKMVTEIEHKMIGDEKIKVAKNSGNDRRIPEEVLERVTKINADLLIISTTLDVVNKPYFIGPFSQQIINQIKIPVLSVLRVPNNKN